MLGEKRDEKLRSSEEREELPRLTRVRPLSGHFCGFWGPAKGSRCSESAWNALKVAEDTCSREHGFGASPVLVKDPTDRVIDCGTGE